MCFKRRIGIPVSFYLTTSDKDSYTYIGLITSYSEEILLIEYNPNKYVLENDYFTQYFTKFQFKQ